MRFDAILVHVLLFIPIVESSWRRAASWIKVLDTLFNSVRWAGRQLNRYAIIPPTL